MSIGSGRVHDPPEPVEGRSRWLESNQDAMNEAGRLVTAERMYYRSPCTLDCMQALLFAGERIDVKAKRIATAPTTTPG